MCTWDIGVFYKNVQHQYVFSNDETTVEVEIDTNVKVYPYVKWCSEHALV